MFCAVGLPAPLLHLFLTAESGAIPSSGEHNVHDCWSIDFSDPGSELPLITAPGERQDSMTGVAEDGFCSSRACRVREL